jgi:hypothetical protein
MKRGDHGMPQLSRREQGRFEILQQLHDDPRFQELLRKMNLPVDEKE